MSNLDPCFFCFKEPAIFIYIIICFQMPVAVVVGINEEVLNRTKYEFKANQFKQRPHNNFRE